METGVQLGGLYKKATYLDEYRKTQKAVVIVDSGDLFNEDEEIPESVKQSAELKADLIARIYNKIGIDAVGIGDLDLVLGIDFLKELEKKHNFPFVCANLVDDKGAPIFKRYVVKNVGGKNVGIFGLMGDTADLAGRVSEITDGAATVQDALEAAEAVVKELTGKVDYVIALTHQGTNRDWVVARRVEGINLVVGGHDKQKTADPHNPEATMIVKSGEKGQYLGLLELALDDTKSFKHNLLPFGEEISDDASVKAMITEYNDKIAEIYGGGAESRPAAADVKLRLTACEPCHSTQVQKWHPTAHAKAYETLVKKSKQYDPKCLVCHTTRFEQPEGFSMKEQQMELVNLQCETCHGWGKEHMSEGKPIPVAKPTPASCLKCHTEDRCPDFEEQMAEKMKLIEHKN